MARRLSALTDPRSPRSRRRVTGAAVAAGVVAGALGLAGPAGATPADRDVSSELAEAQFRVYLLTHTELRPTDVTCSRPPTQDSAGEMLCFALIEGRETIAALATLESPGVYSFTAITKSDSVSAGGAAPVDPVPSDPTPSDPAPAGDADQAVLDAITAATTTDSDATADLLLEYNETLTSVDSMAFDEVTSTLQVQATSTADAAGRDSLAWSITDTMAYLWEADSALGDTEATIQPRLEVIIDEVIYGTPYEVMRQVAEYEIGFEDWLAITTGSAADAARNEVATDASARVSERVAEHQQRHQGHRRDTGLPRPLDTLSLLV